jgi:hypothetical protein
VQQVGRVAPAVPGGGMAAVQSTVGEEGLGRHDVAGAQCGAELVEHPGDIGHRRGQAARTGRWRTPRVTAAAVCALRMRAVGSLCSNSRWLSQPA